MTLFVEALQELHRRRRRRRLYRRLGLVAGVVWFGLAFNAASAPGVIASAFFCGYVACLVFGDLLFDDRL